jgi:hypothetical protein
MPNTNAKADADGQIQQLKRDVDSAAHPQSSTAYRKSRRVTDKQDPRLVYGTHEEVPQIVSQESLDPQ